MFKTSSLSKKLTLATSFLIVLTVAISILVSFHFGKEIATDTVTQKLSTSQSVQKAFTNQRAKQLELISLLVASDPAFVAYISEAISQVENNEEVDTASIHDLILERKQQFGFDFAMVTTPDGNQVARSDLAMVPFKDLSEKPLLASSMESLTPQAGFWSEQEAFYQASIIPLARGRNLTGFLVTGLKIDNALANEISLISGSDVIIVHGDDKELSALASTHTLELTQEILKHLSGLPKSGSEGTLTLNQQSFSYELTPFDALQSSEGLALLSLVSKDLALQPFINTSNVLILTGIFMAIIGFVLSYLLIKSTMKPLDHIARSTAAFANGDYEVTFPKKVNTDLLLLSNSVNKLSHEIRGRDALSAHLITVSKNKYIDKDEQSLNEKFKPGSVLGKRFKVIEAIGSGGMGFVLKAMDLELNEVVALKILKQSIEKEQGIEGFKEEIRIARRITNPYVVRIYDYGVLGKHSFISMEYINGFSVQEIINQERKLTPLAAKSAAIDACLGLQASHESGIIHKDIKPANLIVSLDSKIKLMDFGIASFNSLVTKDMSVSKVEGTTDYLSPEQILGKGADERSDIFAMGVLIMQMFVGHRPFHGVHGEDLMLKIVNDEPVPVKSYWADAPDLLENIVSKCLEKKPNNRYQRVSALLIDLKKLRFD